MRVGGASVLDRGKAATAAASSRGVIDQNADGARRKWPKPNVIAVSQGKGLAARAPPAARSLAASVVMAMQQLALR